MTADVSTFARSSSNDGLGGINIINYSKLRKTLKIYCRDVDANMNINNWELVKTINVINDDKSVDIVMQTHTAHNFTPESEYAYRRFSATGMDSGGTPILAIYRKQSPNV